MGRPNETVRDFAFARNLIAAGVLALATCCAPLAAAPMPVTRTPHGPFGTVSSAAGTYTIVYAFMGQPDGANPQGVAADKSGNIFGNTRGGGEMGDGSVFELSPNGSGYSEFVVHSFDAYKDGLYPQDAPFVDGRDALYVATMNYGSFCGDVVELSARDGSYRETRATEFPCEYGYPQAPLKLGKIVYLSTEVNSTYGGGTITALSPPKLTQTVIYTGFYGEYVSPSSPLAADESGALYGTATDVNGPGLLFEFVPAASGGTGRTIWHFARGGGQIPSGGVTVDKAGDIYGTTVYGGRYGFGVVYKLVPNGSGHYAETILHEFAAGLDGSTPAGGVVLKGNVLYGTTTYGGAGECENGCGTLFRISTSGTHYAVLHSFGGPDGAFPSEQLTVVGGAIFGATAYGGVYGDGYEGNGIVFRYQPQ